MNTTAPTPTVNTRHFSEPIPVRHYAVFEFIVAYIQPHGPRAIVSAYLPIEDIDLDSPHESTIVPSLGNVLRDEFGVPSHTAIRDICGFLGGAYDRPYCGPDPPESDRCFPIKPVTELCIPQTIATVMASAGFVARVVGGRAVVSVNPALSKRSDETVSEHRHRLNTLGMLHRWKFDPEYDDDNEALMYGLRFRRHGRRTFSISVPFYRPGVSPIDRVTTVYVSEDGVFHEIRRSASDIISHAEYWNGWLIRTHAGKIRSIRVRDQLATNHPVDAGFGFNIIGDRLFACTCPKDDDVRGLLTIYRLSVSATDSLLITVESQIDITAPELPGYTPEIAMLRCDCNDDPANPMLVLMREYNGGPTTPDPLEDRTTAQVPSLPRRTQMTQLLRFAA